MINPAFIASLEPLSYHKLTKLEPLYYYDEGYRRQPLYIYKEGQKYPKYPHKSQTKFDRQRDRMVRNSLAGLEQRAMFFTVRRLIKRNTNKLFSDVFIGYVLPNFWKIRAIMGYKDVKVTYSDVFKTIVDLTYKYNLHCSLKDPKEIFRKMFSE